MKKSLRGIFKTWRSPLAVTLILVMLIAAASFWVTEHINREEEENSFSRLEEEAGKLASAFEQMVHNDREELTLIAEIMADRPEEMEDFLRLYQDTGDFFSHLELLMPGDQVITEDGKHLDVSGQLSFEEEAELGAHISDREQGLPGEGLVVRHMVPVQRGGETVAMLCGVIELGTLKDELPYAPYGGQAAVYVVDGATGDFLIDTWHTDTELGNIWALGSRPMAPGYDRERLYRGVVEGESNFVVFVSKTINEYLYFYYRPLDINQWRVALSVPEELVFAKAKNIRGLLNVLLAAESIAFLLYICWMVFYVRRETGEKQRQLDILNHIYDVESLLFNAHEHQENVPRALEVIARMLPARRVAFTMLEREGKNQGYLWEEGGASALGSALLDSAPTLAAYFARGKREVIAHSVSEVRAVVPAAPDEMDDLVAIPVEDSGGVLRGILAAGGLSGRTDCAAMLRSVGFSYASLCVNMHIYRAMQRQGTVDVLTGLYNRNRYEQDLAHIAEECSSGLSCIFIDVNGLHELNNSRGHEAGDRMLKAVAREIQSRLGGQHAYRVGGDEFIIFTVDVGKDEVIRSSEAVAAMLAAEGYYVSVGVDWHPAPVEHLDLLVKTAEKRMYDAKRAYYQTPGRDRRAR